MGEKETTKLDRLKADKERLIEKIQELKAKLKKTDEAIKNEENLAIIGTVRSSRISLDELADLLKSNDTNDTEGNNNDTKTE